MAKSKAKSPYAKYNKTPFKYPDRERTICPTCGGILFRGLTDGSTTALIRHRHLRRFFDPTSQIQE